MAWFDRGLNFTCQGCGHCCSGEPGFVFLSAEEIDALAAYLDMSNSDFLSCFCRLVDREDHFEYSLKERADYSCVFLKDNRCQVYPVRPLQCSTYPFWDYLMQDRALWDEEKKACPGVGCGALHDAKEIREKLQKGREHHSFIVKK